MPSASPSAIDIYDPDLYREGVPHERFRHLRRHDPVHWQPLPASAGGGGYWLLTRHEDVMAASADPATFSAARGGILVEEQSPEQLAAQRTQLLSMDPPSHTQMRRHVLARFTPGLVAELEPWLRARCAEILDAAAERRECDFVREVASELPLQAICEILGVPEEDRGTIVAWGDRIIGRDDPELADTAADEAAAQLGAYGYALAQRRRRRGGGGRDLVSLLLEAEHEGHRVGEVEFAALFVQIAVAGNETTRSLLSGGLLALLEHREAWGALARNPAGIPDAVEEMLRWVTPVHYFRRTATRDVELRGVKIREGEKVALLYASANRDEEVFEDPDRFDVRRDPNPHLAFGWGQHFCLGARLARLEARVFWEEFFRRVRGAELTGPPRRLRSNLNNSWKQIPLRLLPHE